MRRSSRKLLREQIESCLHYDFQSSHHKFNNSYNIAVLIAEPSGTRRRNFCSQTLLETTNERLTTNSHLYNHPYRRNPGQFGCSQKSASGETYSFLQSSGLQHSFKNWQEKRMHKLTASTFGGAIGLWPRRRVRLWLEKIGAIEPFSGNLATCWSNIKEEEALERYKLITGNTVLFPEFHICGKKNQADDWLAASPDGVVYNFDYGLPSCGVLEIKCPFFNGDMSKAYPRKRVPLYYMPQAQGLMEIMDMDWMDYYVWTVKGSSLFRIYRDEEYWDVLKMALSDFWWKHVQPAREQCSKSLITDPLKQLKLLKPAPKHELCSYIVDDSRRVVDNSRLLMREINGKLQD
ncbi:YqaJ domain-containing protein [Cephalotus follicularis]|uniref:YqaJ domain-containing protein n=1 Tax=Cephalotus follicularis TaxID=3775 RepID=A0A1Q3CAP5_CEPFO|nr:YqaJ domain-containing protein [Cephalotus follicularis]